MRRVVVPLVVALVPTSALAGALLSTSRADAATSVTVHGGTVRIGHARFQVLSPTLVRVEYASDDRFEDRPTMTVPVRRTPTVAFTATQRDGELRIRTSRITVAYRPSGPPDARTLTISGTGLTTGHPSFPAPTTYHQPPLKSASLTPAYVTADPSYRLPTTGNLGGWYRALDGVSGPVKLHDGLLDRRGWYLLDDTQTVVTTTTEPGYVARDLTNRTYRDGYLFGYGHDYARGLRDLADLVGPAPLLPRNAFAPWWSKYAADPQSSYAPLVARFAKAGVHLGVIDVDTDAKAPHVWNGWEWSKKLFPDPKAFTAWAHARGIDVGFNIHPSIALDDPAFVQANTTAGGLGILGGLREDLWRCRALTLGTDLGITGFDSLPDLSHATGLGALDCRVFDWGRAGDQAAYLALHKTFTDAGVDLFWLDYCCDESSASGVGAADPWVNRLYADAARARGSRWPVLSRVGSSLTDVDTGGPGIWAERRDTIHFTGDAASTWDTLRFETAFTAAEGNVGLPYVSHDIGGYLGTHLPDDLYVRWVQAGTFAPIMRLHSNHGDRLPWEYGAAASRIATSFLRLRDQLVPYLYTVAHQAVTTGLPMTRALYLQWPRRAQAYRHPGAYLLGRDLLVAPVTSPSSKVTFWVPPGRWTDFFTGKTYVGPAVRTIAVPLSRSLVLRRAGSILPLQTSPGRGLSLPPTSLTLDLAPGRQGSFTLYDDAGDGLGYLHGQSATTRITQTWHGKTLTVRIGAVRGSYPGMPAKRSWTIKAQVPKPHGVTVDGKRLSKRAWSWKGGELVVRASSFNVPTGHSIVVH
jgi:hypothetical protein